MIIDCAAYADGARISGPIALDDVPGWLDRPDTFVWLGLRMPNRDEMARVSKIFELEDLDVDAVVAPHRRPVLDRVDDATWLVLRTAERVVDDYGPALDGFEGDVLEVEKDVFSESRHRPTQRLYRLKREILELLIVTDALHDPLERALRTNPQLQEPTVHGELLATVDQLGRIVTRTHTLSDLIATAIDANMTQVSLQQNEDMRKISAWVAIAAVPTMIAGIYGMNFEHMPELESTIGYPAILLLMATVCGALYRAFRRSGWL